jgi:hypothetical protein
MSGRTAATTPRKVLAKLLPVAPGVYATAGLREGREKILGGHAGSRKARSHPFAKLLKAPLFRQQNQAVTQAQNRKGRAYSQPEVVPELFGNRKLPLFADLGRRHVFEGRVMG